MCVLIEMRVPSGLKGHVMLEVNLPFLTERFTPRMLDAEAPERDVAG